MRRSSRRTGPFVLLAAALIAATGCATTDSDEPLRLRYRVPAGETQTIGGPVLLMNQCDEAHEFGLTTDRPDLLRFVTPPPIRVPPSDFARIESELDASNIAPGEYSIKVVAECTDCIEAATECVQGKREVLIDLVVWEPFFTATIHIYSGREDPSFTVVGTHTVAELRDLFQQLQPDASRPAGESVLASKLGYKGITVEMPGGYPRMPQSVVVFRQHIQSFRPAGFHVDDDRALELFLLDRAVENGAISERFRALILGQQAR